MIGPASYLHHRRLRNRPPVIGHVSNENYGTDSSNVIAVDQFLTILRRTELTVTKWPNVFVQPQQPVVAHQLFIEQINTYRNTHEKKTRKATHTQKYCERVNDDDGGGSSNVNE